MILSYWKPAAIVGAVILVIILAWVFWKPAIPPEVKLLEEQAAAQKVAAGQAKLEAEAAKAEAADLLARNKLLEEELRATLNEIPAVRERRRAARTATRSRVAEIRDVPDARARDVLLDQHDRTSRAIERFRAGAGRGEDEPAGPAHP